jgi:hypothetical protein
MVIDKGHLHHAWTKIRVIKPWYFLALAAVFGLISIFALRHNNLAMIKLREQVYQADEKDGDAETALRNLREYVYGHMNTDLSSGNNTIKPPIQLKHRYERLVAAQQSQQISANSKVYSDAQIDCERRFPQGLYGSGRIPCIQEYVDSHGAGVDTSQVPPIQDSLYKFDFVSPRWSPDLAGWSLVATVIFGGLAVLTFISDWWLRSTLRD